MYTIGIICEYNPLHLGHAKQLAAVRRQFGPDCGVVCLMSGNFVQRGYPAILDKSLRAQAALCSGADLVLELPVQVSLSSAEGFASGGVGILAPFCDGLCFGAETADVDTLMAAAEALLSPAFPPALAAHLRNGISFPSARQAALEDMGLSGSALRKPNDILAIEYCKAILTGGYKLTPLPIPRRGDYHAQAPDPAEPSATSLRLRMEAGEPWLHLVPPQAAAILSRGTLHTRQDGERPMLARLRTMDDGAFEALPYGSEGLWRKLMHAARQGATLEDILQSVKSKRYTRSRLDRMVMCAFLGLSQTDLSAPAPYVRVLALNRRGRAILNAARATGTFLNAGQIPDSPYWHLERRVGELYGLFARNIPDPPAQEARRRVIYMDTDHADKGVY